MRSVVYRYDDLAALAATLDAASGQGLPLPPGEQVRDGEWVLALFELSAGRRATAAAGRGAWLDSGLAIVFERRDWERLSAFAHARPGPSEAPPHELPSPTELERRVGFDPAHDTLVDRAKSKPLGQPPEKVAGQPRVLVVDDDPDLRDVLGAMLEAVGLQVEALGSAEEAMAKCRSDPPDLMVLDWNLPGMSGLELCRTLRHEPSLTHLPVLFLTAHSATQDMVEAFAVGADDYVVKPFRAAELGARIFGLLRRARISARREGA